MLDWEGNMIQRADRVKVLLADIPEDILMSSSLKISSLESSTIDHSMCEPNTTIVSPPYHPIATEVDEVASVLVNVSPIYDPKKLYSRLSKRE